MKSECKQLCELNGYLFKFFNDKTNFVRAVENCTNYGGWLASDLDCDAFKTINRCCSIAKEGNYFIGLNVSSNNQCVGNHDRSFEWIKSGNCTDGSPLKNITLGKKNIVYQLHIIIARFQMLKNAIATTADAIFAKQISFQAKHQLSNQQNIKLASKPNCLRMKQLHILLCQ